MAIQEDGVLRAMIVDHNRLYRAGLKLTLESAIEWIADDELVEVTPKQVRVRKRYLTESDRKVAAKK